jgi:putative transposase
LQTHDLILRQKRSVPKTTNSAHSLPKYPKLIVGYCLHPLLTVEGSLKALEKALQRELPSAAPLVHHSDRGNQYYSFAYIQRLRQAGIAFSMTQQGDPYENAVAERVKGIFKTDFRLNRLFTTFDEAARAVEQSARNYNHLRPYMSCGYLTPAAAHTSIEPLQKHCSGLRATSTLPT